MASSDMRFELLARAIRSVRAALDEKSAAAGTAGMALDDAMAAIARDVVEAGMSDWCLIQVTDDGARAPRLVTVAHRDPAEVERARSAAGTGPLAARLGWTSVIDRPLASRGRAIGTLTLASARAPLGAAEEEVADLLADVLTGALDSALLSAERDEMLSVVSHDLRNPLGVILLVVDLLRGVELPDLLSSQMSRLERASQVMSRIITDVVDVGRLGTPSVPLELGPVSPADAVDAACHASAALAESRSVSFERSVDPGLEMTADRGRLARALDLLVSGAVQRTPAGRSVLIAAARDGERVLWSIADGAPVVADAPTDGPAAIRRRAGAFTWMVVRGVVRAHGGAVWIEETSGRVSVRFALPLATASRTSSGAA